ncbi:MAG: hypothetical protein IKQ25_06670 [Lachnospiraceae bacterium]|nr:hypothetical protein [Lachnospiraceae bacterium]
MKPRGNFWKGIVLFVAVFLITGTMVVAGTTVCDHHNGYPQTHLVNHYSYTHSVKQSESQGYQDCHVGVDVKRVDFYCPDCGLYSYVDTLYEEHHSIDH